MVPLCRLPGQVEDTNSIYHNAAIHTSAHLLEMDIFNLKVSLVKPSFAFLLAIHYLDYISSCPNLPGTNSSFSSDRKPSIISIIRLKIIFLKGVNPDSGFQSTRSEFCNSKFSCTLLAGSGAVDHFNSGTGY